MKLCKLFMTLILIAAPLALRQAMAQTAPQISVDPYVPRLADIMSAMQLRHLKLFFAAHAHSWKLAEFELTQLRAGLAEAAVLYDQLPVPNIVTLAGPVQALSEAIKARDEHRFKEAFGQLTEGCNACHTTMDRGFIVITQPTAPPFTNQLFGPDATK